MLRYDVTDMQKTALVSLAFFGCILYLYAKSTRELDHLTLFDLPI